MDLIGLLQPHLIPAGLGVFVGLIMALTGAGGGILSVPLLVFVLHLPMVEASPIGLLAVTVSSALGAIMAFELGYCVTALPCY